MKSLIWFGLVAGLLALVFVHLGSGRYASVPPAGNQATDNSALVARGREVAVDSDCVACHTLPHGPAFTGGLEFHSPFGLIVSTNITPDPDFGIGNYSREDFYRAVQHGYSRNVGNLYPAMPYTSYRKLSNDDMDSLWAYFQSIEPVAVPNRPNELSFLASLRFTLGGWNQLFFDDSDFQANPAKGAEWNRGKYLVEGSGHCGECHTPRNRAFAMKPGKALQGAVIEGWNAVDITAAALTEQGWTATDLNQFLMTGESRLGITFESMYLVVDHSLSQMNRSDIAAMTAYLLDQEQVDEPKSPATEGNADNSRIYLSEKDLAHPGYDTYVNYCAGCHGVDGLGKPGAVVGMNRNSIFRSSSAFNAIAVVLRGLPAKRQDLTRGSVEMPAFAAEITDSEVAGLVNFARQAWGNSATDSVDVSTVADLRRLLQKQSLLTE